jgi:hypothetical protein
MTWIDLAGRDEPVLVVEGRVHLHPDDVADPALRRIAAELWAEFQAVRDLAEPVAETLARLSRQRGGPVSLLFPDTSTFGEALDH